MSNAGSDQGFGIGLEPDDSIVINSFQAQQRTTYPDPSSVPVDGAGRQILEPDPRGESFLSRITPAGELDQRFGTGGTVRLRHQLSTFELGLSIQPDGKIVVAGRRGGIDATESNRNDRPVRTGRVPRRGLCRGTG